MFKKTELLLFIVAAGWGIGFPVMKLAISDEPVTIILWLRFVFSSIIMFPLIINKLNLITYKFLLHGMLLGSILGVSFLFLIFGLKHTTASNTGFLAGLSVIWVVIIPIIFKNKPLNKSSIVSSLFGLLGIFVISDIHNVSINYGDILVIIGSIFTSFHILYLDRISKIYDNTVLTVLQLISVSIVMLIANSVTNDSYFPKTWSFNIVLVLFFTSIFSTVIAFWIQTKYQKYTSPERAALIYNFEPVFSAFFAVLILKEIMSTNVLIGGAIILLGMCIPSLVNMGDFKSKINRRVK